MFNQKRTNLKTIIESFQRSSNEKSDILSYTIQPTANCQLGCNYCGQVHENLNLTNHQSDKIYQYIEKELSLSDYKGINTTWYGAEPLLGITGIRYLSEKLLKLANAKKINYDSSIITNGLAMKENVFEELANFNIRHYQITLDGTEEIHDNSRFTKKNGKTYKLILKNIVKAVNHRLILRKNA